MEGTSNRSNNSHLWNNGGQQDTVTRLNVVGKEPTKQELKAAKVNPFKVDIHTIKGGNSDTSDSNKLSNYRTH